jgi:hypothetical protein
MEREEFKRVLREKDYPYEETLTRIMVGKYRNAIDLSELKSIPSNVVFRNMGSVSLDSIEEIPSGVVFMNGLYVYLNSLRKIDPSVRFFNQGERIYTFTKTVGDLTFWSFSFGVPGIEDFRVLNKMISLGLFWRR